MVFQTKQATFEGPLELLLELIENEKLAISDVSLGKVTEEYLAFIRSLEKADPEELAEFLVVAAQLMLIKSRSLLPNLAFSEEEEASAEELEGRLAAYKRFRDLALLLKEMESRHAHIATREAFLGDKPIFYPSPSLSLERLHRVFITVLDGLPKAEKLVEEKIRRIVSLEEKMKHIRAFVHSAMERAFSEIVQGASEKVEIIVAFLAILELARQKFVVLHQERHFEEIIVRRAILPEITGE